MLYVSFPIELHKKKKKEHRICVANAFYAWVDITRFNIPNFNGAVKCVYKCKAWPTYYTALPLSYLRTNKPIR